MSCEPATAIGAVGERWVRVYLKECSTLQNDLKIKATLEVPSGIDYNLYLYSPCGTLLAQSTNGPGVDEVVTYTFSDEWGDDSRWVYLEVRYREGISCQNWSLKIWGGNCF